MSRIVWVLLFSTSFFTNSLAQSNSTNHSLVYHWSHGGIIRGDTSVKNIHLVFTGGDYNDGGHFIRKILKKRKVPTHFFFTGDFYRLPENEKLIKRLKRDGHYLGAHSDKHLLYCSWENRDSLLVTKAEFTEDLQKNYQKMARFGIEKEAAPFFMPPYEWYNETISRWTNETGLTLINFTPGTGSNADYTTPDMGNRYKPSEKIFQNILQYEAETAGGLNGFILLLHIGTHPDRTDKFYYRLDDLIVELRKRGYRFTIFNSNMEK